MASKQRRIKPHKKGASKIAQRRELEAIESALGEEFSSLSEARKAFRAESTTLKDSYTVRELSTKKHSTIRTFLPDIEQHKAEIDELKRPQDFWAAEIYGYGTYSVHGSISDLAKKLASYRGLQEENPAAALKHIKIIRIKGQHGLDQYLKRRREQTKDSWKRAKEKHRQHVKRQKKQAKQLEKMKAKIKEQAKLIRKLQRGK